MSCADAAEGYWAHFVDEAIEDIDPGAKRHRQLLIWAALRAMDALTSATARRWLADKRSFQSETRPPALGERLRDMYLSPDAKSVEDVIATTMAYGSVTAGFIFPQSSIARLAPAVRGDDDTAEEQANNTAAAGSSGEQARPIGQDPLPLYQAGQLIAAAALVGADMQTASGTELPPKQ